MLAALGGVYLADGFDGSFNFDMTDGRGFIALAAVIFGKWNPFGALAATLLFGFSSALAVPAADVLDDARHALPGAAVRAHARRRGRPDGALAPARRFRHPLREGVRPMAGRAAVHHEPGRYGCPAQRRGRALPAHVRRRCCARAVRRACACSSPRTARWARACTRWPAARSSTSARSSTAVSRLPDAIAGARRGRDGPVDARRWPAAAWTSAAGRRPRRRRGAGDGTSAAAARSRCCWRAPPTSTTWCRRWSPTRSSGTRSICACAPRARSWRDAASARGGAAGRAVRPAARGQRRRLGAAAGGVGRGVQRAPAR